MSDKFKDECGIFGIYSKNDCEIGRIVYYGLYALQHRGQESAGIAVNDSGTILYHKDMGLANEIFDEVVLNHLKGKIGIGHVRYSTFGSSVRENAQPMVIKYRNGQIALAHNGNLVNAKEIRKRLEEEGVIFQTTIDSEVILNLISRHSIFNDTIEKSIMSMMKEVKGGYSIVIMSPDKLIGIRDLYGLRPLCLGKMEDDSMVLASESCALDSVNAKFIRDIKPGEIVIIDENGINSIQTETPEKSSVCIFEHIYFARPDSIVDGASVYNFRIEAGKRLYKEHPVEADVVIGVPDSGVTAALGFAQESGIPYGQGLIRNRYVGRTFIQPKQEMREKFVKIKLNPLKSAVEGKRIVMIDDSIVRGTTLKRIVSILREAGAKEVHVRISSPPIVFPCFFGIDTPTGNELVASAKSVEEIRKMSGADSLGYLSLKGLLESAEGAECEFCTACFSGEYPIDVPIETNKFGFEKKDF